MQGFAPRITSIKGLSEVRRLPRLGKICLGKKVKRNIQNPGCSCGPQEGCFKCTYPKETTLFRRPSGSRQGLWARADKLRVKVPLNDLRVVFPQALKYYGSGRGLKCVGNRRDRLLYEREDLCHGTGFLPLPAPGKKGMPEERGFECHSLRSQQGRGLSNHHEQRQFHKGREFRAGICSMPGGNLCHGPAHPEARRNPDPL